MYSKLQKGSLQLVLLIILGITVVFSVAAFAAQQNPIERPITIAVCQLRPNDIACVGRPAPVLNSGAARSPQLPPVQTK